MKNIHYKGSLSSDLKDVNKKFNISIYFSRNSQDFWLIPLLIVLMIITKAISNLNVSTIIACYSYSFLQIIKRYKKAKEEFNNEKKEIKEKFDKLGESLSERKKMRKMLKRAKVFESIDLQEEMDRYIEHITSDIYYINSEDKIALLREVKLIYSYKEQDMVVSSTDLYRVDDNELPPKPELPVKQVLKLKKGI